MSKDFITDSDMPAAQQVNNFMSNFMYDSFVTYRKSLLDRLLMEQSIKSSITCELNNKII